MLRVVLSVLLAVALLGVAFGAVEDARTERSEQLLAGEAERLTAEITDLVRGNPAVLRPAAAARRVLTISVPAGGFAGPRNATLAIGAIPGKETAGDTDRRDVLAYQVDDGTYHVRWLPVDVRIVDSAQPPSARQDLPPDGKPLVLSDTERVTLALVSRGGRPVVLVSRHE